MGTDFRYGEVFSLLRDSLSGSSLIHESAVLLSGILALIALLGWYSRVSSGDRGEGHLPLLRAGAILLCVWYFPSFVLGPLDGLSRAVTSGITESLERRSGALGNNLDEAYRMSEEAFSEGSLLERFDSEGEDSVPEEGLFAEEEDTSFWGKVKSNIEGILSRVGARGLVGFKLSSNTLSVFVGMISKICRAVLSAISGMYLIILGEAGPLVFALSILPSFRKGIHSWISKYIQVSFWVPVCSFVFFLGEMAKESVAEIFSRGDFYHRMVFPSFQFTIIDLSVIILMLSTPKICSWLIGTAGPGVFSAAASEGKRIVSRKI